ncbi:Probable pectinesterase/pectinesterase inhibitor 21 [Linum grandiflorum]
MGADGPNKKMVITGISSILLVAMVIAVTVGVNQNPGEDETQDTSTSNQISTTSKAAMVLCSPSQYKQTCEASISKAAENNTDPRKIVETGFEVAVISLKEAMKNSTALREAAEDPRAKRALEICEDLMETAINDLRRSMHELQNFDAARAYIHIDNLKTWLEATITYQEVCRDEFQNTTGSSGEKMKDLLKLSGELTSNGLAMVEGLNQIFKALDIPGLNLHRRLLEDNGGYPEWVTPTQRKLLQAKPANLKPDIVVAKDGSGKFKTVGEAVASIDKNNKKIPFVIYVKTGVYKEQIIVPNYAAGLMMIGDGPTKTKITAKRNFNEGTRTSDTATFAVLAPGFIAKDIWFENSAGAVGLQAVAYRSQSDNSVVFNCRFDGYQDTLYPQSNRQFYRDCTVSGTIDFIFGVARAVFQNCTIIIRKPLPSQACIIAADGRQDPNGLSGIVIQNSRIIGDPEYLPVKDKAKAYLARPWKPYAMTVVMHTKIDAVIAPEGWAPWDDGSGTKTVYYAEFENTGPGSVQKGRVTWPGIKRITKKDAVRFTPKGIFTEGDGWITSTRIPYTPGL